MRKPKRKWTHAHPLIEPNFSMFGEGRRRTIKYKVLAANSLRPDEQAVALGTARTVLTGDDALAMRGRELWACEVLDNMGRVLLLKYHGVEAKLYYKREVVEVTPFPGDPLPVNALKDPDDVWLSFELLRPSSKATSAASTKQRLAQAKDLRFVQLKLEVAEDKLDDAERVLKIAEQTIADLKEVNRKLRAEVLARG